MSDGWAGDELRNNSSALIDERDELRAEVERLREDSKTCKLLEGVRDMRWITAEKAIKKAIHDNIPYLRGLVALRNTKGPPFSYWQYHKGELRFFGGDRTRPYWVSMRGQVPLENDAWYVAYYMEIKQPEALDGGSE